MIKLNDNISIDLERKTHSKASEEYVHVVFSYDNGSVWDGWIPVEYRRTGVSIKSKDELRKYVNEIYLQMAPQNFDQWLAEQRDFWEEKPNASVTKSFFDVLVAGGWKCVECELPKNPNWARRVQDLKEYGYTIATDTHRYCNKCQTFKTHLLLLPIGRQGKGNGYEVWSPKLRKKIVHVLEGIDVYENKVNPHVLPDHKFSEIRWDEKTLEENPDDMSEAQIKEKFQLLTNQRNQEKREVCRTCFQTGKRGKIFGISFYYAGNENWDNRFPKKGRAAEAGCVGCPWYDIAKWREELLKKL